jgi:hypothetical protein
MHYGLLGYVLQPKVAFLHETDLYNMTKTSDTMPVNRAQYFAGMGERFR